MLLDISTIIQSTRHLIFIVMRNINVRDNGRESQDTKVNHIPYYHIGHKKSLELRY